jgi:hypothetical protein
VDGIDSATVITPCNVGCDFFLHLGPPIIWLEILIHFTATRMDRQSRRMGFSHDLISKFFVFGYYKSIIELENSFVVDPKVLGLLLFHLPLDVKHTHISLLEFDNSTSKRAIHSDIVEYYRMKEMCQMKVFIN